MKKIVLAFGLLCAIAMASCIKEEGQQEQQGEPASPAEVPEEVLTVTGVAVDGAMNSVYLKVGEDTLDYSFPDLDSDKRASWDIDDTLTVKYVETEYGDSVVEIINENE